MLRTRLVLGLLCLLIILLAMGLYSIDRCSQLGKKIQIILNENFETIQAIQKIRRGTSETTAALLSDGTGSQDRAAIDFAVAAEKLEKAISQQELAVENNKDRKLTQQLRQTFTEYKSTARQLLELPPAQSVQRRDIAKKASVETVKMMDLAEKILEENQNAIQERNSRSGEETNQTIRLLILAMIAAVVVAIYASFRLTRSLLDPLASLTTSIQQIGEGNLDQQLTAVSKDELGQLADSFNKMTHQLKEYRTASTGKMAELNQTIQLTISSFPDPIFVINSAGNVEFRNPSADALALKLLFAGVGRLPDGVEKLVAMVLDEGKDFLPTLLKDAIRFHFDHQDHYYLPRIVLLRNKQEAPFGVAVILEDITRVLLMDELKTNLISTVSHELKTPLTSVRLALYLILEKAVGSLNENQEKLLTTARDDADRLLNTLNDLLDLTRLESGSTPLTREAALPEELISQAISETRDSTANSNRHVIIDIEPGLPSVAVDRQRIGYVFTNLLTNAIKYSREGGEIRISAQRTADGEVRFAVKDQGEGIGPEHIEHIFEKFYRVPGTQKVGSGLGLSIAREIVRAHDGTIGGTSTVGEGSEFYVILPSFV